jgi:hypothetical protein
MPRLLLTERQAEAVATSYPFCNPAAMHSLTAIRLGIFKNAIGGSDATLFESSYDALYTVAQQALTCSPADSFVWLTLFWIDAARHGLTVRNENYLRMSYTTAPNEAWIAMWRSHLAFALFDRLPPDLAADSVDDFIKLLKTGRGYWEMAKIFENTSANGQSRIAERLQTIDHISHQAFVNALRDRGNIALPDEVTNERGPQRQ